MVARGSFSMTSIWSSCPVSRYSHSHVYRVGQAAAKGGSCGKGAMLSRPGQARPAAFQQPTCSWCSFVTAPVAAAAVDIVL
jgi:hypothetical protein